MITTSKGFLEITKEEEAATISEELNLEENLDALIREDCGDISIGEWAFLQEGDIDDAKVQLLEEVLDEIDGELLESENFINALEFEDDEEAECLDEAVKTTVKRIAAIAKKKPMKAAKVAAKRVKSVAGKAGRAAIDKLKVAAKAASTKAREYAAKARELAAEGKKAASEKAKLMASKLAQKAKDLKDKIKGVVKDFQYRQSVIKKRKAGMPVQ